MNPPLEDHYQGLERRWRISDRCGDYGRLVTAAMNQVEPVHDWFNVKEAYSPHLLQRLFKDASFTSTPGLRVLDPFCGSGTTLLSALELTDEYSCTPQVVGLERNPFMVTLARAKVAALLRGPELAQAISAALPLFRSKYSTMAHSRLFTESATLNNTEYFSADNRRALLALAASLSSVSDDDARDVMSVALAGCIEMSGRLRRDGRALRYVADRVPRPTERLWHQRLQRLMLDLRALQPRGAACTASVIHGDARDLQDARASAFDWIVFSPPYPNNIDYTEVYKLENWVLGLYSDASGMREERMKTIRSHPSVRYADEYRYARTPDSNLVEDLLAPVIASVPEDRYRLARKRMIRGYADDMLTVMRACRASIKPHGYLAYVVGNSRHGSGPASFVIAADIIIARLAEFAGWRVEEIRVARRLHRRGTDLGQMRESVVVLRPA